MGKQQTLAMKKVQKEEEEMQKPKRKHSTQMSIVTWLTPTSIQKCAMYSLIHLDLNWIKV